ncbi:MAG: PqiC family protein [Syntrophobacteraceae bacterium]
MGKIRMARFVALMFSLAALGGCARSAPIKYYILRSMQGPAPLTKTAPARSMVLGVGPVTIPPYLDRPQIVTKPSPDTLQFAEFDRWAEPLDKNIARVFADDLSRRIPDAQVCVFPWRRSIPVKYQITLDILHLEKIEGDRVLLEASWKILGNKGKKLLLMNRSKVMEPVEAGAGFSPIASAESRAVAALSRQIATALASMAAAQTR